VFLSKFTRFCSSLKVSQSFVCDVLSASNIYGDEPTFITPPPSRCLRDTGHFAKFVQAQDRPAFDGKIYFCIHSFTLKTRVGQRQSDPPTGLSPIPQPLGRNPVFKNLPPELEFLTGPEVFEGCHD
jgi:hypothetical protein